MFSAIICTTSGNPAKAMNAGRTIYAFEPNSENFACAKWTTLLNALSNVQLRLP